MILSIIIPIYKVEKYVRGTLESIYNQEFEEGEFEVICVNDGTPDNSMQIVNEYASQHTNLRIINQMNQGLSCTRNAGLRIAQGEYVWFVDSDDTLEINSISKVVSCIQSMPSIEIWGFNITRIYEISKKEKIEHIILKRKNFNLYNTILGTKEIVHKTQIAPVQRFVFKHSFLEKNHLVFYPKIYHEDIEFMTKAFFIAKQIQFINYAPYRYLVRNSGSIMSSINIKSVRDKLTIATELDKYSQKYAAGCFGKAYFNDMKLFLVRSILKYPHPQEQEFKNIIKSNRKKIKSILVKGLWANCYLKDFKKCMVSIILLGKL